MFYRIENNNVIDFADHKYLDECLEIQGVSAQFFRDNRDGFEIQEGVVVDCTDSAAYATIQAQKAEVALAEQIKEQIRELDYKRIRAMCEPQIKNAATGETWLEYYTQQIQTLRATLG